MAEYHLASLDYAFLSGDVKLFEIVVPPSIDQLSKIDGQAFLGSSLTSIVLLGIPSQLSSQIQSTGLFGVGHNCSVTTSDAKRFRWMQSTQSLIPDLDYKQLGSAKIQDGVPNKLALGRKIYRFTEPLYHWCTDPSQQDTKKYVNPAQCPMMIIYGDFKTSVRSMQFLHTVLESEGLYTWLKDSVKCYVFLVDRDGCGVARSSSSQDTDYQFYKSIKPVDSPQDFVIIDFVYKDRYVSKTFSGSSLLDFQMLASIGMAEAGFGQFAWEDFDVTMLEDPYEEVIPTGNPSVWMTPWWWNGSSAQSLPDWRA